MLRKIILIKNKNNLGYPSGINQGLKIAIQQESYYFLITNNDIVFYNKTIDELMKASRNSNYGYITAVDKNRNLKYIEKLQSDWWEGLCNSCFIVKKRIIELIGFYDENFGLGGEEDRDFIHRMGINGIESRSYCSALIEHKHGYTQRLVGSNSQDKLRINREYVERKHNIKLGWKFD